MLIDRQELQLVRQETLAKRWNGPCSLPSFPLLSSIFQGLVDKYKLLSGRLSALVPKFRANEINKSLSRGVQRLCAQLVVNCKDNKPPGEIVFRPIHSAPVHCFEGQSKAVASILEEQI